ncbi:MAG TPA: hypothetical protein VFI61_02390 [Patescibacteria group bacterium]|nr:hypothetical protein [Patescibacteria group bacterium]
MYIEIIYLVLIVFALFQVFPAVKELGKSSLGNTFKHFLTVILLLGGIRLFFFFTDNHIILAEEATVMTIWHLMFYLAIAVLIFVNRQLLVLVDPNAKKSQISPATLGILSVVIMAGLFLIAQPFNESIASRIEGTIWDMIGGFHLIAFVFAGVVWSSLVSIKNKYASSIGPMVTPLLISVGTLSVIHLWELLNESWKVINVGEFGETFEKYLWIVVYFFVAYAFWVVRKHSQAKISGSLVNAKLS